MQAMPEMPDDLAETDVPDALTAEQRAEIDELRATHRETLRPTVPALEEILYRPLTVLDRGFVRVVDYMGDDGAIVQAARVSYGRGTRKVREDRGLIRYLMRHRHTTPFEMCEIKYHVKLPIFVARQWIRHRTANVNEYSARYSIVDDEFYMPLPEHLARQSSANRQGRGDVLPPTDAARVLDMLRADAHAQYEIRAYADVMADTARHWVPHAFEAFDDYVVGGAHLSRAGLAVLRRMLAGEEVSQADSGMSPREWRELLAVLNPDA